MAEVEAERGLVKIDGKDANAVDFTRHVEDGKVSYDLRFRMGRSVVHRVKGVDANELVHTVGEHNAKAVHGMPGEKGSVAGKDLHVHEGLSPEGQQQVVEAVVANEVAARATEQAEPSMSAEKRRFLDQQNERARRADEQRRDEEGKADERKDQKSKDQDKEAAKDTDGEQSKDRPQLTAEQVAQRKAAQLEALKKQFILVDGRFFFKDRANRLAFEDRGKRLVTAEKDPDVAAAMVKMAEAKGWKTLKVSGHQDFRRQMWLEATAAGLKVQGYEPSKADLAALDHMRTTRAGNAVEQGTERKSGSERNPGDRSNAAAKEQEKVARPDKVAELTKKKQRAEDHDRLKIEGREGISKAVIVGRVAEAITDLRVKNPETRQRIMNQVRERLDNMSNSGKVPTLHTYDRNAPARAREVDKVRPQVERNVERTR